MSVGKATPGPWEVTRGAQADAFSIEAATKTVAHVKHLREASANASLIAAAPDLLAALGPFAEDPRDGNMDDYPCHVGLCTKEECGRCSRAIAAFYACAKADGRLP